jgi:hypothetical protein
MDPTGFARDKNIRNNEAFRDDNTRVVNGYELINNMHYNFLKSNVS